MQHKILQLSVKLMEPAATALMAENFEKMQSIKMNINDCRP